MTSNGRIVKVPAFRPVPTLNRGSGKDISLESSTGLATTRADADGQDAGNFSRFHTIRAYNSICDSFPPGGRANYGELTRRMMGAKRAKEYIKPILMEHLSRRKWRLSPALSYLST